MADPNTEFPTTIGPDAAFKGQLQFDKGARVLGKFEGEVKSPGQFVIADGAIFSGEAQVGDLRVEGQVTGNVAAAGKVNLSASSRMEGDIQAERLEVAEGAIIVGHVSIGAKPGTQPGASRPVSAAVETLPKPGEEAAKPAEKDTSSSGKK